MNPLLKPSLAFWDSLFAVPSKSFKNVEQMRFAFATGWKWYLLLPLLLGALAWFVWCYAKDGTRPRRSLKALQIGRAHV